MSETNDAFDDESDTTVKDVFKRRYHAFMQGCRAMKDTGKRTALRDLAVAQREARRFDAKQAERRVAAAREVLKTLYADFPVAGLKDCDAYLASITAAQLEQAHNQASGKSPDSAKPAAPPKPAKVAPVAPPVADRDTLIADALASMNAGMTGLMQMLQRR